ncbi:MAG: type II toxin-antitoxin system VapC family toxin [Halorhodospira sp.]
MFLIDTNAISEARKGGRANPGVRRFFERSAVEGHDLFLSVVTVGELRQGVDRIRHRGDTDQALRLEAWLADLLAAYHDCVLSVDGEIAQLWGRLRVPHPENALDKLIAATALIHDLIIVTRNRQDFDGTGVQVLNPFSETRW